MAENSQTDGAKDTGSALPATGRGWLIATIALVAWSCLRFPQATLNPMLDPSWAGVLLYAREKGMQFGHDLVCTYGPLGFLSIEFFSPVVAGLRIFFELALCTGIATGLCLVAWRMTLPWRIGLLVFFICVATPVHWGGGALYLDLGLFAWAFLCFLESGPRLRYFALALVILAAVGALIKITFFVTGLFTIGLLACDLALRRKGDVAAGVVLGFVLAFLLGWTLLGQNLTGLGAYLSTSFGVTSGYNAAMGNRSVNLAWVLVMTIAALAAVIIRVASLPGAATGSSAWRHAPLLLWLAGLLFVEWKYSSVRSDFDHVALLLGVVPIAALCLEALPASGKRARFWSRAAALLCVAAAILFLQSQVSGFALAKCVKHTGQDLSESFTVLSQPARYVREKTDAFHEEQKREQLPRIRAAIGSATADVFGQNQMFALFNELNYHPRPVFQSYAAYSRSMMELNERFYLSPEAPEYVLFHLEAIDGRFSPLEDSFLLRDLLANYELAAREADYLLLRRKRTAPAKLTLLKEGTVAAGEKIDLRNYRDAHLWLEIELQPTWFGRLQKIFYKPPETRLTVWSQAETPSPMEFNAPATMLSAGFLASPLVTDNQDVLNLYTGVKTRLPGAFSVEPGLSAFNPWQSEIHFRIYRIEK